jgi:hypothetical protein
VLAVPGLVVAAAIVVGTPYLRGFRPEPHAARALGGVDDPGAMKLLLGVIALRSVAWFGLITFVPLWETGLGHSKSHGNHLLALMLFAGGVEHWRSVPSQTGSAGGPCSWPASSRPGR